MNFNVGVDIGDVLYRVDIYDFEYHFEVEELEVYSIEFFDSQILIKSNPILSSEQSSIICEASCIGTEQIYNNCRIFTSKEKAQEFSDELKRENDLER